MITVDRNAPPTGKEVELFQRQVDFVLPTDFIEFFTGADGAMITGDDRYVDLWPLTEMVDLNKQYEFELYASEFFLFGSDGGGEGFFLKKTTGEIFQIPLIGMSTEHAVFVANSFTAFINEG